MKVFENAFAHPRTSFAGVLIALVSIMGVLSQQGITFGKVGTGTVVGLMTAIASALLGLVARDPGAERSLVPMRRDQR